MPVMVVAGVMCFGLVMVVMTMAREGRRAQNSDNNEGQQ